MHCLSIRITGLTHKNPRFVIAIIFYENDKAVTASAAVHLNSEEKHALQPIIVFVEDDKTDLVLDTACSSGAKSTTVINNARGEGRKELAGSVLIVQRGFYAGRGLNQSRPTISLFLNTQFFYFTG